MGETIKEVHDDLLELLISFDLVCTASNIKYSLFGGTLIGAIRHQGFIPWDDDADIVLSRCEYNRLVKELPREFEVIRDPWVPRFKKKGSELFIDLFIFDNTSNLKIGQKLQVLVLKCLQGMIKTSVDMNKGNLFSKFLAVITFLTGKLFGKKIKLKIHDYVSCFFNKKNTEFIISSQDQFRYIHIVLPHSILSGYKRVPFENVSFLVMNGYDIYLRKFHGNYMELPPIEKRKPAHGNVK